MIEIIYKDEEKQIEVLRRFSPDGVIDFNVEIQDMISSVNELW